MKIKHLLTLLLTMATLPALAQGSGIKGKVVSRGDRAAIEQVKITLTPGERQATSDAEGRFRFDDVASGDYTLTFEADDYEPLEIKVRVDKLTKDVRSIALVPVYTEAFDDSIFAEFDTETANDTQSLPSSLSSSKDVFNNIASYKFGEMRFNLRGYDSQYTNVYFNGIRLNDALTGYTPWSLWSGLNDATRNQENTTGLQAADYGLGGIGGTTNINATASQIRKGLRVSLVNGNSMYRFRAMVSYASGLLDNGWSYAFSVSTRQGGNDWVNGIYYNCFGYYGSVEKRFNERNRLAFTILGAPTERGAQQASTQEVYDLVGNNYYNPNWGYQDGKKRNARVRNNHEPLMVVNYTNTPDDRTKIDAAASFRFGTNGYSALTWKGGADPRPDYYRNLPSYYMANNQFSNAAQIAELWRTSYDTRQINWDRLYDTNYRGEIDEGTYGAGHRSNYMIEERHTDQLDLNLTAQIARTFRDNSRLVAGILYRWNRTEYYDKVKDLLGGDYWVDIDKFAERDFVGEEEKQNDLHYYYEHGHARRVEEGDKFGYDYYANVRQAKLWAMYNFNIAGLDGTIGGEVGQVTMWRDGRYRKGTYPANSFGNSEALDYFTYQAKLNLAYRFSAAHSVEFNAAALQNAPTFQNAFISPRTRTEVTPGLKAEKIWGVDASYNLSYRGIKARLSGYYTMIHDQTDIISYYDDLQSTFVNFAISGIDKKFFGLEFGMTVPLYMGLSLNGAVSVGQYTYDSNPTFVQLADNSSKILSDVDSSIVYWKDMRVESTPQTAVNVGLSYRSDNNWFASADLNFYDNNYLSMNPLFRTDEVLRAGATNAETAEMIRTMRAQEKFDSAFVLNASLGKNWYIKRNYTLGFSLEVKNILNNQDIKTGGYEQMRLNKIKADESNTSLVTSYERFDPKYFYMFGTTYYLNVYFRF